MLLTEYFEGRDGVLRPCAALYLLDYPPVACITIYYVIASIKDTKVIGEYEVERMSLSGI